MNFPCTIPYPFNQLNSECQSQHLNLNVPIVVAGSVVEVFYETGEGCGGKFRPIGKMPLTFQDTSDISTTHGADCESHQHISPKQNQKTKKGDDGSGK